MRKVGGVGVLALVLAIAFAIDARAEVVTSVVPLSTAAEINPAQPLPVGAKGSTSLTINIVRDGQGNITSAIVNFLTSFSFPGAITISGHHIHEAGATANGPIVIDPGSVSANYPTGQGTINLTAIVTNADVIRRLLANPAGFYVNLHTTNNPGGAMRGQILRIGETIANTVEMTLQEEVPAITDVSGIGVGTITINVRRGPLGEVIGGTVWFTVNYDFVGEQRFSGLHIHEQVFGVNGPVVINTGLSNTNLLIAPTGRGTVNIPVEITAATLPVFQRLLANPPGFYVNIHTTVKPGGVVRGQLKAFSVPPVLTTASSYVVSAPGPVATLVFTGYGLDSGTAILMNGQLTTTTYNADTGELTAVVPSSLQGQPGQLVVQARKPDGLRSLPLFIAVANPASQSTVAVATTDGAKFAPVIAPEAIASAFGATLASVTLAASTAVLPTVLDGSSLFINGSIAQLFFVSPSQVNFLVPGNVIPGLATVVVVAKDGKVSQGTVNVARSISAIFTSKSDGTGAPAARASADGVNFNVAMGLADGSPVAIDAGNFVMMFATGLRGRSGAVTLSIGGTAVTPSFVGPHATFVGLDQINYQIPASLAGRGDVDLTMTVDGQVSNVVKLRIK